MRRCMVVAMVVLAAVLAACGSDSTGPHVSGRDLCAQYIGEAIHAHGAPYSQDTTYHTYGTSDTTVTLIWDTVPPTTQAWTWYGSSEGCFEGLYQSE